MLQRQTSILSSISHDLLAVHSLAMLLHRSNVDVVILPNLTSDTKLTLVRFEVCDIFVTTLL